MATVQDRHTISLDQFPDRAAAIARATELEARLNLSIFEVAEGVM